MEKTNKYQVMPRPDDEVDQALLKSIRENGVQVPVVKDAEGAIIDGHERVRAWKHLKVFGHEVPPYPETIRDDLTTDAEKRDLAWRLNMQRRHLNQAQRREVIAAKLKESPGWTDNRIAELLAVDDKTVRSVRTSLEARKELARFEYLEGSDGKRYPRERPRAATAKQFMRDVVAIAERDREKHIEEQVKDLEDAEKVAEFLEEPATEVSNTPTQTPAQAVSEKMRELANVVDGYEDKIKSEAGPEAVADAVVELLGEWIESFVPLVEAKLEDVHTGDQ